MDINSSEPSSSLAAPKSVNLYTKLKQNSFYFYTFHSTKLKNEFWIASNTPGEQWTGSKRIFSEIWPKSGAGLGIRKFLDGIRDLTATGEEGFAKILARDVVFEKKTVFGVEMTEVRDQAGFSWKGARMCDQDSASRSWGMGHFSKFTAFTQAIMYLVYPPKFASPLSSISLGTTVIPRRNRKQWLCKILGGKQGALWPMWK